MWSAARHQQADRPCAAVPISLDSLNPSGRAGARMCVGAGRRTGAGVAAGPQAPERTWNGNHDLVTWLEGRHRLALMARVSPATSWLSWDAPGKISTAAIAWSRSKRAMASGATIRVAGAAHRTLRFLPRKPRDGSIPTTRCMDLLLPAKGRRGSTTSASIEGKRSLVYLVSDLLTCRRPATRPAWSARRSSLPLVLMDESSFTRLIVIGRAWSAGGGAIGLAGSWACCTWQRLVDLARCMGRAEMFLCRRRVWHGWCAMLSPLGDPVLLPRLDPRVGPAGAAWTVLPPSRGRTCGAEVGTPLTYLLWSAAMVFTLVGHGAHCAGLGMASVVALAPSATFAWHGLRRVDRSASPGPGMRAPLWSRPRQCRRHVRAAPSRRSRRAGHRRE